MGDLASPDRISRVRNKFSSIMVISLEIRIAFSSIRYRCAVEVCSARRDPDHDLAAERNQTKQFSQVSRDLMNDFWQRVGERPSLKGLERPLYEKSDFSVQPLCSL
jgi:hypothetical protein